MANEISVAANLYITVGGFQIGDKDSTVLSLSSSNSYYTAYPLTINTGSWIALPTGSATNTRYLFISNVSSSVIGVAATNTGSVFSQLQVNDFLCMPGSGSTQYFVNSSGSTGYIQVVLTQA